MSEVRLTIYSLKCDTPRCPSTFSPTGHPSGGGSRLYLAARDSGWDVSQEHRDYCPRCAAIREHAGDSAKAALAAALAPEEASDG